MFSNKPSIFRFIFVCVGVYLSSYVLANITGNLMHSFILYQMTWLIICSFIFSYGLIQIYKDVRGIVERIRRKFKKRVTNGEG